MDPTGVAEMTFCFTLAFFLIGYMFGRCDYDDLLRKHEEMRDNFSKHITAATNRAVKNMEKHKKKALGKK